MPHAWIANCAISFWGWRTAHQVLPWSIKMQIHWLHFLKEQWHGAVTVLILYRENSKVMLAHEISFNIMVSENSKFPWLLTIFSAWVHYITHNMLYCCRIRIGNWFWNWTRSLFTQVDGCNSLTWSSRGLCEGVQVRQSLQDPSNNYNFHNIYLFFKAKNLKYFWNKKNLYLISNTGLHTTFLSYYIPFMGKHEPNKLTCSQLCDFVAQLVRALHRHRRGHGFESRWVTWIFQVHETIA